MRWLLILTILGSGTQTTQARNLEMWRSSWRQVTAGAALMLALPLSSTAVWAQNRGGENAPDRQQSPLPRETRWHKVFARSPAEFRSVMNLQMVTPHSRRLVGHLIYLGQDRNDEAMFITMHSSPTLYAPANGETEQNTLYYILQDWDGTVWEDVSLELIHLFPTTALDFYGLSLLKITGLTQHELTPVQLAGFPYQTSPLNQLGYFADDAASSPELAAANAEHDDNAIAHAELSLYWQRCQAGTFDHETQLGTNTCASFPTSTTQGEAIFNALTLKAVGFYLIKAAPDPTHVVVHKRMVLGFAPAVRAQVEALVSVSPRHKLPLTWGTLKDTQQ